jgi:hypothetical protein
VLPGRSHPTYRLQAEFTPVDPPLPAAGEMIDGAKGPRGHVGGELVAPAWELVRAAAELNQLDVLDATIRSGANEEPEAARNVRDHLIDLTQGRKRSVQLCTHNLPEAEKLCRRLSIVQRGRQVAEGTPAELKSGVERSMTLRVREATPALLALLEQSLDERTQSLVGAR